MLAGKLALHDIRDVEAFTAKIIPAAWETALPDHDYDDLHAYLIATTWELSLAYQPGGNAFSTYATHILRRRINDWLRQRKGRTTWAFSNYTHHRTIPILVSYELLAAMEAYDNLTPELARTLANLQVDDPEPSPADLQRILDTPASQAPPADDSMGRAAPRLVA